VETVINFSIQAKDFEAALSQALDITRNAAGNIDADIGVRISSGSVAHRLGEQVTMWNWHCEGMISPSNIHVITL